MASYSNSLLVGALGTIAATVKSRPLSRTRCPKTSVVRPNNPSAALPVRAMLSGFVSAATRSPCKGLRPNMGTMSASANRMVWRLNLSPARSVDSPLVMRATYVTGALFSINASRRGNGVKLVQSSSRPGILPLNSTRTTCCGAGTAGSGSHRFCNRSAIKYAAAMAIAKPTMTTRE